MIDGWKEFISNADNKLKFAKAVEEHRKKYEMHLSKLQEWIPVVGKDKKLTPIADSNLQRSEYLSMLGVSFAVEECRSVWGMLERDRPQGSIDSELAGRTQSEALRLDFTMTYYQLNCLLLDNFHDLEHFTNTSRL
jgi:hypothetical protein